MRQGATVLIKSIFVRYAGLMVVVAAITGCAATVTLAPESLDRAAKQFSPLPDKANIYLTRTNLFLGSGVLLQVYLDRQLVGSIAPGTYLLLEVEPGTHRIAVVTQENQDVETITAERGQNYFVDVNPEFGLRSARAGLQKLSPEEGRKAVQNAKRAAGLL